MQKHKTDLSYKEYDSYYMIVEAFCVYFEDDICVRLSFLNEVPQTARGVHKDYSYSQLVEQYGDSFEKHTYAGHGIMVKQNCYTGRLRERYI